MISHISYSRGVMFAKYLYILLRKICYERYLLVKHIWSPRSPTKPCLHKKTYQGLWMDMEATTEDGCWLVYKEILKFGEEENLEN